MNLLHEKSIKQCTLWQPVSYVGIGLHSGKNVKMTIKPASPDTGIQFIRTDITSRDNVIPAHWYNVTATQMCTTLSNKAGISVSTVEHLMAALHGCGVDNAIIEIDGPEVPIMDGSAAPFVAFIEKVGTLAQQASRKAFWIHRPIEVNDGDSYAIILPSDTTRITVEIDFPDSAIGFQTHSVALVNEAFRNNIAHARTFGFKSDLQGLRNLGLAQGGSLKNAILVDGDRILNEEGLRFQDEFVRHKILDTMGDLALLGAPIFGHVYAHKPGHRLNNKLIKQMIQIRDAWSYTTLDDIYSIIGEQQPSRTVVNHAPKQAASN